MNVLLFLSLLMQMVNALTYICVSTSNIFIQMLILQSLAEHGQGVVLFIALLNEKGLQKHLKIFWKGVCERLGIFGTSDEEVWGSVLDINCAFPVSVPERSDVRHRRTSSSWSPDYNARLVEGDETYRDGSLAASFG